MPRNRVRCPQVIGRGGFTRVELGVVLIIALVVIGLTLTFIPRLRERANRLHCQNNLRQIGEGIHQFRDHAHPQSLPASRIADHYATWAVQIAPYLPLKEVGPLEGWDLARPYAEQPAEVRSAQIRLYYCPSRRYPPQESSGGDVAGPLDRQNYPGALSDYACAAGDGDPRRPWTGRQANGPIIEAEVLEREADGRIRRWRGRTDFDLRGEGEKQVRVGKVGGRAGPLREKIEKLKKGTSQTILIGEKHVRPDNYGAAEGGDGSVYNGGRPASFARIGGRGHGLARSPDDPFDLKFPGFGGPHPGICQFLLADGSVRPITITLSEALLGEMMVRDED